MRRGHWFFLVVLIASSARADEQQIRAALASDWKRVPHVFPTSILVVRDTRGETIGKRDHKLEPGESPLPAPLLGERKGETLVGVEGENGAARLALWVDELRSIVVQKTPIATTGAWPPSANGEGVFLEPGTVVSVLERTGDYAKVRTIGAIVATGRLPLTALDTQTPQRARPTKAVGVVSNGTILDETNAELAKIAGPVVKKTLAPHREELRADTVVVVGTFKPTPGKPPPVPAPKRPPLYVRLTKEKLPIGSCLFSPGSDLLGVTTKPMFVPTTRDEIWVTELRLPIKVVPKRTPDGKGWEQCGAAIKK